MRGIANAIDSEGEVAVIKEIAKGHFVDIDKLNDESIIIDAGAAWGDTIEELRTCRQTKSCRIFALECHRDHIKTLEAKKFHNVIIYEKALVGQDSPDNVTFYQHLGLPGWGNLTKAYGKGHRKFKGIKTYEVEALRINDLFDYLKIDKVDFLKMDIEGSECGVLETMSREMASKIKQISVEVHVSLGVRKEYVEYHMKRLGFEIKVRKKCEIYSERRN